MSHSITDNNRRLYPLLLREELHVIVRLYNRKHICSQLGLFDHQTSFLSIKRTTNRLRNQRAIGFKYQLTAIHVAKHTFYLILCLQSVSLLLAYSIQPYTNPYASSLLGHKLSTVTLPVNAQQRAPLVKVTPSIHSLFWCIENRWPWCNSIIKMYIKPWIHPEILFRIIRQYCQDASILHEMRYVLYHGWYNQYYSPQLFLEVKRATIVVLWSMYATESDNLLFHECSRFLAWKHSHRRWLSSSVIIWKKLRTREFLNVMQSLVQKGPFSIWTGFVENRQTGVLPKWGCQPLSYHYVRYKDCFILGIQTNLKCKQSLQFRYYRFQQRRFGKMYRSCYSYWAQSTSRWCKFLGFVLQPWNAALSVKTGGCMLLPPTCLKVRYTRLLMETKSILHLLERNQICSISGYALNKSNWTVYSNTRVIEQFKQIYSNMANYYSACNNSNALLYFMNVIRYSCAKTLACKHKKSLQSVRKEFSLRIAQQAFVSGTLLNTLEYSLKHKKHIRVWHLYSLQPLGTLFDSTLVDLNQRSSIG